MKLDETQLLTIGEAIANNPHTSIHTVKLQYLQSKAAETILTHQAISAIFKIKSLTTLDISRNEYKQIPIGVDKIQSHLKIIICNNSKLPFTIPANIKDQGDDALFGYLRDLYKGSEKCSSARLTLVGSGFAGKTTLVKKLHDYVNSTFYSSDVTASTRTRTDGVEVTSLILIIQLIQPIKISNLLSNCMILGDKRFSITLTCFS